MVAAEASALPIVLAVPHGGRDYPQDVLAQLREPEVSRLRLEDRMVDLLGQAIAEATGAALITAHAPRAMIDLNRATDDVDWGMVAGCGPERAAAARPPVARGRARHGLGLVPRRLPGLGEIWRGALSGDALNERIALIHEPYHHALAELLARVRARWGAALLIDLHSMPPVGSWTGGAPPQYVIGDRFGAACSGELVAAAFAWFARASRPTSHNRPYAGGYVLERHAAPRRNLHGMQIEVDRRCYLDSRMVELGTGFAGTVALLAGLVAELADRVATLGADWARRDWPEAAE